MNGITVIKPVPSSKVTTDDLLSALLVGLGCSVGDMPTYVDGQSVYSGQWEIFDPEQVTDPEKLPDHWKMVYRVHHSPAMGDCVEFHYRYLHAPVPLLASYPRLPLKGIFCILSREADVENLTGDDLIFVGDELEDKNA